MGRIWTSWPLWAKMAFFLLCAMVAVIFLGSLVLLYKKRKLRKYTALDEARVESRQELGQINSVTPENAQEAPFGIRALEAGIEIEGVWISKPNTPASSLPGTPHASVVGEPSSSRDNIRPDLPSDTNGVPLITMPPSVLGQTGPIRVLPGNFPIPSSSHLEPPRLLANRRARTGSPTPEGASRGRSRYRPRTKSNVGYSDLHNFGDDNDTVQAGGRDYDPNKTGKGEYQPHSNPKIRVHSPGNEGQLIASNDDRNALVTAYQPQSSHPPQHPVSATPPDAEKSIKDDRTSLDALATHRLSHVAETGQLGPRTRRPHTSNVVTPSTSTSSLKRYRRSPEQRSHSSYSGEDKDSIELQVRHPPARYSFEAPLDYKFSDPTMAEPNATSMPLMSDVDSTNFDGAQEALQYMTKTKQLMRSQEHADGDKVQSDSEQDVLRTVNSGFKILKPGTFDRLGQSSDTTESSRESVSFIKRQSRKLLKKSPESIRGSDSLSGDSV